MNRTDMIFDISSIWATVLIHSANESACLSSTILLREHTT